MKKSILNLFTFIFLTAVTLSSCREQKTTEDKIDDAVENVGDAVEDAADDIEDKVD